MSEMFGLGENRLSVIAASLPKKKSGPLTLETALKRFSWFESREAYYINTDKRGILYFGLIGNSTLFEVPEEVYEKMGRPELKQDLPVRDILTAAGFYK